MPSKDLPNPELLHSASLGHFEASRLNSCCLRSCGGTSVCISVWWVQEEEEEEGGGGGGGGGKEEEEKNTLIGKNGGRG